MSAYVLARDADLDLDNSWEYIAEDDIDAADRWIEKLFEAFENLVELPVWAISGMTSQNIRFYSGRWALISSSTGQTGSRLRSSPLLRALAISPHFYLNGFQVELKDGGVRSNRLEAFTRKRRSIRKNRLTKCIDSPSGVC